MVKTMSYSVGEVAELAHVTVRTLHHYDEVGLLRPTERSTAGYRGYTDADLARLQRILFYRELEFGLEEIATILDDRTVKPHEHLRRQRSLLLDRVAALQRMVNTVEKAMEANRLGVNLDPAEMFEVFGDVDPTASAAEAESRWGESDAWRESQRRTALYTKEHWKEQVAEAEALRQRFAAAFTGGAASTSAEAMELAEEHRAQLERWFFDCSYTMHRGLGDLYVQDPRFGRTYVAHPGLVEYVRDAIHANAARHGA